MLERNDYFNPLDKQSLAASLAAAFMKQQCHPMPPKPIAGAGVYALYYAGNFPSYRPIAQINQSNPCSIPIYIGKAIPRGGRKGGLGFNALEGKALLERLKDHARSIEQAKNLSLNDFSYRYLVVDDIWIPLAENILISTFNPIWNIVIDGFGIHDPGEGRKRQAKSDWDIVHPGRTFADLLPEKRTSQEILARLKTFYSSIPELLSLS